MARAGDAARGPDSPPAVPDGMRRVSGHERKSKHRTVRG
jgi:hypothetical protein